MKFKKTVSDQKFLTKPLTNQRLFFNIESGRDD